jgi:hypothetical protein
MFSPSVSMMKPEKPWGAYFDVLSLKGFVLPPASVEKNRDPVTVAVALAPDARPDRRRLHWPW